VAFPDLKVRCRAKLDHARGKHIKASRKKSKQRQKGSTRKVPQADDGVPVK
jgi:hypothetical protein